MVDDSVVAAVSLFSIIIGISLGLLMFWHPSPTSAELSNFNCIQNGKNFIVTWNQNNVEKVTFANSCNPIDTAIAMSHKW